MDLVKSDKPGAGLFATVAGSAGIWLGSRPLANWKLPTVFAMEALCLCVDIAVIARTGDMRIMFTSLMLFKLPFAVGFGIADDATRARL